MTGFIAVHCGAGQHTEKNYSKYNKLSRQACRAGMQILKNGGSALEAVKAAVIVLEDDPLTNAGHGSNLTTSGVVEADASIMDGKTLLYGGCGAVQKVKNPIALAHNLLGDGAYLHAKTAGIKTIPYKELISPKALKQFKKYKKLLDAQCMNDRMDTVGAVCIDDTGHVASGCSSGGLLMKRPGRVGQAALYASGVWADSFNSDQESSVAVCTTGCGEHLVQTQLAKEIGIDLKNCTCPTTQLCNTITEKFLKSRYLSNVQQKLGGALVLYFSKTGEGAILWGHTTESMSVGYMRSTDQRAKSMISHLPKDIQPGTSVNIGGTHFYIRK
ncbi:hypothetical protein Trydic_g21289 [Trypoxylus dichotomus]